MVFPKKLGCLEARPAMFNHFLVFTCVRHKWKSPSRGDGETSIYLVLKPKRKQPLEDLCPIPKAHITLDYLEYFSIFACVNKPIKCRATWVQ